MIALPPLRLFPMALSDCGSPDDFLPRHRRRQRRRISVRSAAHQLLGSRRAGSCTAPLASLASRRVAATFSRPFLRCLSTAPCLIVSLLLARHCFAHTDRSRSFQLSCSRRLAFSSCRVDKARCGSFCLEDRWRGCHDRAARGLCGADGADHDAVRGGRQILHHPPFQSQAPLSHAPPPATRWLSLRAG